MMKHWSPSCRAAWAFSLVVMIFLAPIAMSCSPQCKGDEVIRQMRVVFLSDRLRNMTESEFEHDPCMPLRIVQELVDLGALREGITQGDVVLLIGPPESISQGEQEGEQIWSYTHSPIGGLHLVLREGNVVLVDFALDDK